MNLRGVALTIVVVLATGIPLQAKKSPPRPFFLQTAVTLNGAEIPAGIYELTVEPGKSGVRVTLSKYGHFVATAPGSWVKSGVKYSEDAVLLRVNPDGSRSIIEIRLAGAAKTIVLNNAEPVSQFSMK